MAFLWKRETSEERTKRGKDEISLGFEQLSKQSGQTTERSKKKARAAGVSTRALDRGDRAATKFPKSGVK